jgi:hypothetical protein
MTERWLGIVVASDKITVVDAEVDGTNKIVIQGDHSWSLQKGDRAAAYNVVYQRVADYARDHKIARAIVKGSVVSLGGTKLVHLHAAELRGVVTCALAKVTEVEIETKARISKTFGTRKVDEYLKDNKFWEDAVAGKDLRAGSREAAMVILAGCSK